MRPNSTLDAEQVLLSLKERRDSLRAMGVKRLGLIGSTARGEARSDSDLDFVVELEDKSWRAYVTVKHYLEDLFQRSVDLIMLGALKPWWRERVLKEARYAEGL